MNMEWFAAVSGSDGKANLDCKDAETAPLMGDGIAEDDRHLNRVNTPLLMNRYELKGFIPLRFAILETLDASGGL